MKKQYDEPIYTNKVTLSNNDDAGLVRNDIQSLLDSESFAVLSTQGEGQPYSSLICYAATNDLKQIVFATPSDTRKFNLILKSKNTSMLIDNRSSMPDSLNTISAITITGKANIVEDKTEINKFSNQLISVHPYLRAFVESPTTKIIVVDVCRYFYVRKFQEVIEWSPNGN